MYYADLTTYRYCVAPAAWSANGPDSLRPEDQFTGAPGRYFSKPPLNVGWLDELHEFTRYEGDAPAWVERLERFCREHRCHQTRGVHRCPFCAPDAAFHQSDECWLASAEIVVQGRLAVYQAPALVAHYVRAHHYLPPADFVQAFVESEAPVPSFAATPGYIDADEFRAPIDPDAIVRSVHRLLADRVVQGLVEIDAIRFDAELVEVRARFRTLHETEAREWKIPRSVLVNNEQSALGLYAMLCAVCQQHSQAAFEQQIAARRKAAAR